MKKGRSLAAIAVLAVFLLAEIPFGLAEWVAAGRAPEDSGLYDIIIKATYNGVTGILPLRLAVNSTSYQTGNLTIRPVEPVPKTPPISLRYDIHLDGTYDFEMASSNITIYYVSGGTALKSEDKNLSKSGDYWGADIDVPLKGEYTAVIKLVVIRGGQLYGGQFLTHFTSDRPSDQMVFSHSLDKRVLMPAESFEISATAAFQDVELPGLDIFKAYIYGDLKALLWDGQKHEYRASFTAPTSEGAYLVNIYASDQESMAQEKIYVAEVSKAKSARCPLSADASSSCNDMKDVRRCVADWKSGSIALTEEQLTYCFESATGGLNTVDISCNMQAKGDFDGDTQLTPNDLDLLQNLILPMSPSARQDYKKCADYNLDNRVDTEDLKCLTNVVAGKWYGDLNGGICIDSTYDSPLKGDLTGDKFVKNDDVLLMRELISCASAGIKIPQKVLDIVDFDQNGKLNQEDMSCLNYFVGMELARPDTLLANGETIPAECMNIYHLDECQGIRGDLNGDLRIDSVDEILVMLAEKRQITGYDMSCADVNNELGVTLEDVECVKSYTGGNREYYFTCIGCNENTPRDYRAEYEICGDGYDNNCDGLVDRTSEDPNADYCRCLSLTPCWMVWDNDNGLIPGVDDSNVKVCRKVSWDETSSTDTGGAISGYRWRLPTEFICGDNKECESVECGDTLWKCAFDGLKWEWYEKPSSMPNETDDPLAMPKLCEDKYDNDCLCGDKKCKVLEQGNMFTSWQFWVGFVLGAALAIFCPPCAMVLFYVSLAMSAASFFVQDPGLKAMMAGFSMGVSVGSLASNLASKIGTTAVEKAAQQAGENAAKGVMEEAVKNAGEQGLTGAAKEAAVEAAKKAAEEAAKNAATEAAKKAGQTISEEALKKIGEEAGKQAAKTAATTAASQTLMGTVLNSIRNFAQGVATGSSGFAKMVLGIAASQAFSSASQAYAKSKGEWVTMDHRTCD